MERDQVNRLLDGLQSDLKTLIGEARKKYPSVKEVSILKLQLISYVYIYFYF